LAPCLGVDRNRRFYNVLVARPDGFLDQAIHDVRLGRNVESGFRALFDDFYSPVVRFFRNKGLMPEESRDLAQEVFIIVYRNLKDLRDEAHFRGWLFSIASNVFKNYLTSRNTQKRKHAELNCDVRSSVSDTPQIDIRDTAKDPLTRILDEEVKSILHGAMLSLPEQMSKCVLLRVVDDLAYEEIAGSMGISVGAVKAHLFKARKELKAKLGRFFDDFEF